LVIALLVIVASVGGGAFASCEPVGHAQGRIMVNDNYTSGTSRVPFDPDDPAYGLVPNPQWTTLRVGDIVTLSRRGRLTPSPYEVGKIMGIEGALARVRWKDRQDRDFELRYLVKVRGKSL
jgi:hypothetical protein